MEINKKILIIKNRNLQDNQNNQNPSRENQGRGPGENKQEINQARPAGGAIVIPKSFGDFAGGSPKDTGSLVPKIVNETTGNVENATLPGPGLPGIAVGSRTNDRGDNQNRNNITNTQNSTMDDANQTKPIPNVLPQSQAQALIVQGREASMQNQNRTEGAVPLVTAGGVVPIATQPLTPLSNNATAPFGGINNTSGERIQGLDRSFLTGVESTSVIPVGQPLPPLTNNASGVGANFTYANQTVQSNQTNATAQVLTLPPPINKTTPLRNETNITITPSNISQTSIQSTSITPIIKPNVPAPVVTTLPNATNSINTATVATNVTQQTQPQTLVPQLVVPKAPEPVAAVTPVVISKAPENGETTVAQPTATDITATVSTNASQPIQNQSTFTNTTTPAAVSISTPTNTTTNSATTQPNIKVQTIDNTTRITTSVSGVSFLEILQNNSNGNNTSSKNQSDIQPNMTTQGSLTNNTNQVKLTGNFRGINTTKPNNATESPSNATQQTNATESPSNAIQPTNATESPSNATQPTNTTESPSNATQPTNATESPSNATQPTNSTESPSNASNLNSSESREITNVSVANFTINNTGNATIKDKNVSSVNVEIKETNLTTPEGGYNITLRNITGPENEIANISEKVISPKNVIVDTIGNILNATGNNLLRNITEPTTVSFLQSKLGKFSFLQIQPRKLQNITVAPVGVATPALITSESKKSSVFENKTYLYLPLDLSSNDSDIRNSLQNLFKFLAERRKENNDLILNNVLKRRSNSTNLQRKLFISNQTLNDLVIDSRNYYLIYDDLGYYMNNTILFSDNIENYKETYCVDSISTIISYIKENFAGSLSSKISNANIFYDKLLSLFYDVQNEIIINKCSKDFLVVSEYDILSDNPNKFGLFVNSTKIINRNIGDVQSNPNNIITYCVDCPDRFKNNRLYYPYKVPINRTGFINSQDADIGIFKLQMIDNWLLNSSKIDQKTIVNQNGKKIGYFYLSSACLNQKPFTFGVLKNVPDQEGDSNEILLSYSYNSMSLDNRCMSRSIKCLNKPTNQNLTYCASDYLSPSCSGLSNLNGVCRNPQSNFRSLRSVQQITLNKTVDNNTIVNETVVPVSVNIVSIPINYNLSYDFILDKISDKNISTIPYLCDLKNYLSGSPLIFKNYKGFFNYNYNVFMQLIKNYALQLFMQNKNQAIFNMINNYTYDSINIDISNSSFYDLFIKQSYGNDQPINIAEPILNYNVGAYLSFNSATTQAEFEPKLKAYLEMVRQNTTNLIKENFINNCLSWIQNNLMDNSIKLNPIAFANYSNLVIKSNLDSTQSNPRLRVMQQTQLQELNYIIKQDPTLNDPVLRSFVQNNENAFQNASNYMKNISKIEGSTIESPGNSTEIGSHVEDSTYFAGLAKIDESKILGNMSKNFDQGLIVFYNTSAVNNKVSPEVVGVLIPQSPQNQTSVAIQGAQYLHNISAFIFALFIMTLI